MTRTVETFIGNSSAVNKAMLKGPWIWSETNKEQVFENKNKRVKLMSNHTKHDFENVLKEKSCEKNTIANSHSLQPASSAVKIKNEVKKQTKELYNEKLYKTARPRPYRFVKLPYGCVWNGKEGRFAIRVCSPKCENDATKKERIQPQLENDNYDKQKFETVHKENLKGGENNKLKISLNCENCLTKSENEHQHEVNDIYNKTSYKIDEQITRTVSRYRTVKLPYGCIWSGKEGRFAVRVVSPKAKNVESKKAGEVTSLHTVALHSYR